MAYLDLAGLEKQIELIKTYINSRLSHYISQEQLSTVAVSGSYNDLTDKPSIMSEEELEAKVNDLLQVHNKSSDAHKNLFQIVNTGENPVGLDLGSIYFELDSIEEEPDVGFSGLVMNGDSTNLIETTSDLIKVTDTYFNY